MIIAQALIRRSKLAKSGPKTEVGKGVVRWNAVQHAALSPAPVVPGLEKQKDWEAHRARIIESFCPETYLEAELAERIALLLWRLKRVSRFEIESIRQTIEIEFNIDAFEDDMEHVGMVISEKMLDKVPRYEAHLHRQFLQTMHELEALQARRRGEQAPLARLDVQS